jgi:fructokinase
MSHQKAQENTYRLGIDLGGTKTEVVVLDQHNSAVFSKRVPTPMNSYDDILALLSSLVTDAETIVGQKLPIDLTLYASA